jgi:WD40 repeat protein
MEASSHVYSLIELNNGNIASGLFNGDIAIWNIKTQLCIATLKGHSESVSSLIQLKNGNLVSASHDDTLKYGI